MHAYCRDVHHYEYSQYHTRVRLQIIEMVYVNHVAQTNIRTCTHTIRHTHETFISIDKRANTHIYTHTHTHTQYNKKYSGQQTR